MWKLTKDELPAVGREVNYAYKLDGEVNYSYGFYDELGDWNCYHCMGDLEENEVVAWYDLPRYEEEFTADYIPPIETIKLNILARVLGVKKKRK